MSHRDGSFEYPQHMFWLRNKKNNFHLHSLIWGPEKPYGPRRKKTCLRVCKQQKGRPAFASLQSDQCLSYPLTGTHHTYLNMLQAKFQFLPSLCS